MDHTINLCRLQRERGSNVLVKFFFTRNEKFWNYDLMKCPMKKGS